MRKHLLNIAFIYLGFETFRRLGSELPALFDSRSVGDWAAKPELLLVTLPGFFIFLLYPLSYYFLFYRFWRRSKKRTFGLSLLSVFIIITLRYTIEEVLYYEWFGYHNYDPGAPLYYYYIDNIYYALLYSGFGIVYFFIQNDHQRTLEHSKEAIEKKQAQLAFLHSQINPHFLFNSLNNIYSLISWDPQRALPAVASLSELMRYSLYESEGKVTLAKELGYIDQYIHLQSLRFEQELIVESEVCGVAGTISIPPLLLITLVENAFKHGSFNGPGPHLWMSVKIGEGHTHFGLKNRAGTTPKGSGGIGLDNVRKRLALLYPDRHSLTVSCGRDIFEVNLSLQHEQE